jgi:Co/Zn/Cd efflux system component
MEKDENLAYIENAKISNKNNENNENETKENNEEVRLKQIPNEYNTNKSKQINTNLKDDKHEYSIREKKIEINETTLDKETNNLNREQTFIMNEHPDIQNLLGNNMNNINSNFSNEDNYCSEKTETILNNKLIQNDKNKGYSNSENLYSEYSEYTGTNKSCESGCSHSHSSHMISKNYNRNDKSLSVFNTQNLLISGIKLFKTNEEFFYLVVLLLVYLTMNFYEFAYGIYYSKVHIISDSFFNYFKTFSFLIAGFSFLVTRLTFNKIFLKNRIELIASLSNCVFLIIVSLYMCLQALHMVTEPNEDHDDHSQHIQVEKDEHETIKFLKNYFVFKVIVNVIAILMFADYIVHPSIQIKLLLWKNHRQWKPLSKLSIENLKESRSLIKIWNNHFENMNALTVNITSDLISSILFLICFFISKDRHFESVYFLISIVNLLVLSLLLSPLIASIVKILMQGRSELYECFYECLNKEVSYFEGCLGVKEMKFWMTAQNEIKCI